MSFIHALAIVSGVGVIVDCSGGKRPDLGSSFVGLIQMDIETFDTNHISADLKDIPAAKPGSKLHPGWRAIPAAAGAGISAASLVGAIRLAIGKSRRFLAKAGTVAWRSLVRTIYPGWPGTKVV
jgi:hypothetical protein